MRPDLKILIVDANPVRAAIIDEGLREAGFTDLVRIGATHGLVAAIETHDPDVVVIDLEDPSRDALADKVAGLDAGADDYLVKPFELDELLARLRAVGRRASGRAETVLQVAGLRLDPATREVSRDGRPLLLSAREFALLHALMERPGAILSRAQLEDRLYGWGEELESNAISVYVHQLRKKLGDELIHTARGVGYYVGPAKGG